MKHFLEISQLSSDLVKKFILRALEFKKTGQYPSYSNNILANLFYENSTRTRVSFMLAANNLRIASINLDLQHSSEKKGESFEDTILNLSAMGVNLFVIRHNQNGFSQALANSLLGDEHIINAGDGTHSHPSQAMLDFMTIFEHKKHLKDLKIAIVGNISHSRVANSLQSLSSLMEVGELALVAPEAWQPESTQYGYVTSSLKDGLADADVIITLRVQNERLLDNQKISVAAYHDNYGITSKTIKYAKKDVMIMHPGPINRGVEIDSDIADGENSFILQQAKNGVFMRMAILESLLSQSPS